MRDSNRRDFLSNVGRGMFAASLGTALASDLGFSTAFAEDETDEIQLGRYEGLVDLIRSTPADKLQPQVARMLLDGRVDLEQVTAANALANAVTFGGCDYVGFHTAMAMLPALEMSRQLPQSRQPLPVLKVMYRNAQQIQSVGGKSQQKLLAMALSEHQDDDIALSPNQRQDTTGIGDQIRDACRQADFRRGENLLATVAQEPLDAFNALQPAVQDDLNVHRYVFAHRTFGLVNLLGKEFSYAILRQCVRFCAENERSRIEHQRPASPIRTILPRLLDDYRLEGKPLGKRPLDDEALEKLAHTIYGESREAAAEATASAIAEGIDPEVIGEAISLASNLYVLRQGSDAWRTHGDSAGVHSSDATNAWRNMVRVGDTRHAISGLIVAAYHAGVQSAPYSTPPYPTDEHRALIKSTDGAGLLAETEEAIRRNDQGHAAAAIAAYGERGLPVAPVFDLMRKYAISEDGRLHGEKYFHTVTEEYRSIRPAFRWRQVVGLARVTASACGYDREDKHGFHAPGYEDACRLLDVEV